MCQVLRVPVAFKTRILTTSSIPGLWGGNRDNDLDFKPQGPKQQAWISPPLKSWLLIPSQPCQWGPRSFGTLLGEFHVGSSVESEVFILKKT